MCLIRVRCLIEINLDTFATGETKLDSTFLIVNSFWREWGKLQTKQPVKLGCSLLFVYKDISSKYLQSYHFLGDIHAISSELSLTLQKLFITLIF